MEWVKDILVGQGVNISDTALYQDSTSKIKIILNPECGKLRTRYIKAPAGVANEYVCVRGEAGIEHINTGVMLANVVTKLLGVETF